MNIHKIKLNQFFADDVLNGRKNFEVRINDRGYQTGDLIEFKVVEDTGLEDTCLEVNHTLNSLTYVITYVLSGWGIENGYVVFGIKEINESEER